VVAEAVSNAVIASRAAYAVGLVRDGSTIEVRDPRLIRIGEMLPSEEIDMSADAALLEAHYAQRLLDAACRPSTTPAGALRTEAVIPSTDELAVPQGPSKTKDTTALESSRSGSADTVGRVELKATVGKARLLRPEPCPLMAPRQCQRGPGGDQHRRDGS
jgi:hypothetical protein